MILAIKGGVMMTTIRRAAAMVLAGLALAAAQSALAQTPAASPPAAPLPPADYADKANWVCWPGASPNACDIDLTTTVVASDGAMTVEPFKADPAAPID